MKMLLFQLVTIACLLLCCAGVVVLPGERTPGGLTDDRLFFTDADEDTHGEKAFNYGNAHVFGYPSAEYLDQLRLKWDKCYFECDSSGVRLFRCKKWGREPLTLTLDDGCCDPRHQGPRCVRNTYKKVCTKEHTWQRTGQSCAPTRPIPVVVLETYGSQRPAKPRPPANCTLFINKKKRQVRSNKTVCFNKFWRATSSPSDRRVPLMTVGRCCRRCHRGRWTERLCKDRKGR